MIATCLSEIISRKHLTRWSEASVKISESYVHSIKWYFSLQGCQNIKYYSLPYNVHVPGITGQEGTQITRQTLVVFLWIWFWAHGPILKPLQPWGLSYWEGSDFPQRVLIFLLESRRWMDMRKYIILSCWTSKICTMICVWKWFFLSLAFTQSHSLQSLSVIWCWFRFSWGQKIWNKAYYTKHLLGKSLQKYNEDAGQ